MCKFSYISFKGHRYYAQDGVLTICLPFGGHVTTSFLDLVEYEAKNRLVSIGRGDYV